MIEPWDSIINAVLLVEIGIIMALAVIGYLDHRWFHERLEDDRRLRGEARSKLLEWVTQLVDQIVYASIYFAAIIVARFVVVTIGGDDAWDVPGRAFAPVSALVIIWILARPRIIRRQLERLYRRHNQATPHPPEQQV